MRYFIVDDDKASRTMLKQMITEGNLGVVIGEAENGADCITPILTVHPDIVLIDLLMPGMDGIEAIEQLRIKGYHGQFIMISQIINKEMVGEAYQKGVEFFIHKPINRIEVQSVLRKTAEQYRLKHSLQVIQESLVHSNNLGKTVKTEQSVKEVVLTILNDMGIIGEVGSEDIVSIMEYLINANDREAHLPPLKDLYEAVAKKAGISDVGLKKEGKAIEQRIRRTIITAVNNVASLGSIDYTNPVFEYYAPRYFDFQIVRNQMLYIQEVRSEPTKAKVNIKKFLQSLYYDTREKFHER